ncbi:MAG: CARDB domain-containing protein [Methylococcaceae bacterium]|nr:CARDB domain-containing protein [Methylococcaceae bacterium]
MTSYSPIGYSQQVTKTTQTAQDDSCTPGSITNLSEVPADTSVTPPLPAYTQLVVTTCTAPTVDATTGKITVHGTLQIDTTITTHSFGCFLKSPSTSTLPPDLSFGGYGLICTPIVGLNQGESFNPVVVVTPTKTGDFTTVAAVSVPDNDTNLANNVANSVTTVTAPSADLAISLAAAPDPAAVGNALSYTATVTNKGRSDASKAQLTLTLPSGVSLATSVPSGCTQTGNGSIGCNLGAIASGASVIQTIVVTPSQSGSVAVQAIVSATEVDPDPSNNVASATVSVVAPTNNPADLAVTISANPEPVIVGNALTYTLSVSNKGPGDASGVNLNVTLPIDVVKIVSAVPAFTPATATTPAYGCSISAKDNTVACQLGNILAGSAVQPVIVVTPSQAGSLGATASVSSGQVDPNLSNNTSSAATKVTAYSADLALALSATPNPVSINSPLTYTASMVNKGPNAASNIQLTLALPSGVNLVSSIPSGCTQSANTVVCSNVGSPTVVEGNPILIPGIAQGASFNQTIIVTPGQTGTIAATALVSASQVDSDTTNNQSSTAVTAVAAAGSPTDLAVSLSAAPEPVTVGNALTYTAIITNKGANDAAKVKFNLTLPSGVNVASVPAGCTVQTAPNGLACDLGALANGASLKPVIVVTPTQAGSLSAVASASSDQSDPDLTNNQTIAISKVLSLPADLSVISFGAVPNPVNVGNALTYSAVLQNNGPSDATGVQLTLTLPTGVNLISSIPSGCTQSGNTLVCPIGNLASGGSVTPVIAVTPTQSGSLSATVAVSGKETDPNLANNQASSTVDAIGTVSSPTDLAVSLSAAPDSVIVGGALTYTATLTNLGPSDAAKAKFNLNLPSGVNVASAPAGCTVQATPSNGIACDLGTLVSGTTVTPVVIVTPTQAGSVTAVASISSGQSDPHLGNNQSSATTKVVAPPADLSVSLSASPTPVLVGKTLTYTAVVQNKGPNDASNAQLTLTLPDGVTFTSSLTPDPAGCKQVGTTVSCPLGKILSGANVKPIIVVTPTQIGDINAVASVSATEVDTNPADNQANLTVSVISPSQSTTTDLGVSLAADPTPATVGRLLTYVALVNNNGPGIAANATLTFTPPAGVQVSSLDVGCSSVGTTVVCQTGRLASGEIGVWRIGVTPTQIGDLAATVAISFAGDPNPSNDQANLTTKVVAFEPLPVDLTVSLSADPSELLAGNYLTYKIDVANNPRNSVANSNTATNIRAVLNLPAAGWTFVSADGGCAPAGNTVTCNVDSLISGANSSRLIIVRPTQPGVFQAQVSVSAAERDADLTNNQASLTTSVTGPAGGGTGTGPGAGPVDLSVKLSANASQLPAGSSLTYKIDVGNNLGGNPANSNTATNVQAVLSLPASNVTFVAADGGCSPVNNTVVCVFDSLIPGASSSRLITIKPTQAGVLQAQVSVSAKETDADMTNNQVGLSTTVTGVATGGGVGVTAPVSNTAMLVISPNMGEVWKAKSPVTINWSLNGYDASKKVSVSLSRNGGRTWTILKAGIRNTGSIGWKPSAAFKTSQARIRVCLPKGRGVAKPICDDSDGNFAIVK